MIALLLAKTFFKLIMFMGTGVAKHHVFLNLHICK